MNKVDKNPFASSVKDQLMAAFDLLRKQNSSYSLRALARDLEMSPSFLNAILKGKKKLPLHRYSAMVKSLRMDTVSAKLLRRSILLEMVQSNQKQIPLSDELVERVSKNEMNSIARREPKALMDFAIFEKWYYIALLDLVTCEGLELSNSQIVKKLGISENEVKKSFDVLLKGGWIKQNGARYVKVSEQIRFPTSRSYPAIREYHRMMISKGIENLLFKTNDADYNRRLITSITFAHNPGNLQKGRERLMELIYEIADIMSEGECSEVYQLNVQLFPLTR